MSTTDALILGSSPNALVAAARLARAGLRVLVLETGETVGGPVATEAFAPGFRADTGVPSAALDCEIACDLEVAVEVIRRDSITALGPRPATLREMPALPEAVAHAIELLRSMYRTTPPGTPAPSGPDAASLAALAARLAGPGPRQMHEVLRLLFMSARDFVDEQPLAGEVRALLASVAMRGLSEGPFASGTLFGFLHHCAVDDGLFRASARGGVQGLARALAERAAALGAEIRTGVRGPIRVHVDAGVARGALLPDGERLSAGLVISDQDARSTFTRLVSPTELEPEVNRAIRALRYRGCVARVHLALSGLPRFTGVDPEALRGTLVTATDTAALERAWDQAKRHAVSSPPHLEIVLPSLADPDLAPAGQHVLSASVQYVPHGRGDRDALLRSVVGRLATFAPSLPELVLHHRVSLPEDLEVRFGLTEGHLYGGEVRLDQAFFLRPIPGFSHHETPIARLHLCGSAAHPGGYSGRSGWNLAGHLLDR